MKHFARTIPSTNYQGSPGSKDTTSFRTGTEELEQAMIVAVRRIEGFEAEEITDEKLRAKVANFDICQPCLRDVFERLAEELGWEEFEYDILLQRTSGAKEEDTQGQHMPVKGTNNDSPRTNAGNL